MFLRTLIDKFLNVLDKRDKKADKSDKMDKSEKMDRSEDRSDDTVAYCEHFLMFMIDLEALLPTRRFFNTVLDDR
jgi:hypothetical protein